MKMEYRLRDACVRLVKQGEARLSNHNYLFGTVLTDCDPLRHEKSSPETGFAQDSLSTGDKTCSKGSNRAVHGLSRGCLMVG